MLHFFPRLSWHMAGLYRQLHAAAAFFGFRALLRYCLHNPLLLFFVEKNARKNARMPHDTQTRVKTP
jgi:hypothetical protein